MHDPDAPLVDGFTHWVLYNIPGDTTELAEGAETARRVRTPWVTPDTTVPRRRLGTVRITTTSGCTRSMMNWTSRRVSSGEI